MYWKGHGYHLQFMRLQCVKTKGVSHHFTVHELPKKEETRNERNVHNPENK